jgi:uncharacterized delta-60 repeat protein
MFRHYLRGASWVRSFEETSDKSKTRRPDEAIRIAVVATVEPLESRQLLNAGDLDTSFGSVGMVLLPSQGIILASAMQSDGKAVLVGETSTTDSSFLIERVTAAGALDATFGTNGVMTTSFADSAIASSVAIQSDGKIIVAGGDDLARYNADGSLDTAFGTSGKLTVAASSNVNVQSISLTGDNGIVVAGRTTIQDPAHPSDPTSMLSAFTVAKFTPTGALDTTFNSTGTVTEQIDNTLNAAVRGSPVGIAVQPDEKVLIGANSQNNPAVWRFNSDGSPDVAFGQNGVATIPMNFPNPDVFDAAVITQLVVQPDGRILAGGQSNHGDVPANNFAVARFNSDGSPDTTFGNTINAPGGGFIQMPNPIHNMSISTSLLLQPDGQIIMGGSDGNLTDEIFRLTSSGSIDSAFQFTPFLFGSTRNLGSLFTSLDLTSDGKILLIDNPSINGTTTLGLARVLGDLTPTAGQLTSSIANTPPKSVIGGMRGSVSILVRNGGATTFTGPISIGVFESTDSTLGIDDENLTTLALPSITIKPGKTKSVQVPFNYASDLATGSYQIIAGVTETDSGTTAFPVTSQNPVTITQPSGDLSLSVIPAAPVQLKTGRSARMVLEITNVGNVKVTGMPRVILSESSGNSETQVQLKDTTLLHFSLSAKARRRMVLNYTPNGDFGSSFFLIAQLIGNTTPANPNTNGNDVVTINATLS